MFRQKKTPAERLAAKSELVDSGCVLWRGYVNESGYGWMSVGGKALRVHRISYELHFGPIPNGLCVLHRCDVPNCIAPAHLFLGTIADNNADMREKQRDAIGERHPGARLTDAEVRQVLALVAMGLSHRVIAERMRTSVSTVSRIRCGLSRVRALARTATCA